MKQTMKHLVLLMLALVLVFGISPAAKAASVIASGSWKNYQGVKMTWSVTSDGTLTIGGKGRAEGWPAPPPPADQYSGQPWRPYNSQIRAVVFEEGVTDLGSPAVFMDMRALTSVTTSSTMEYLGGSNFMNCPNLSKVYLSSNMKSPDYSNDDESQFRGCSNLKAFEVDSKNPYITAVDGVVFTKDMTELLAFPVGKTGTYTIPSGVKIARFPDTTGLTKIVVPASVQEIRVFEHVGVLKEIVFKGSMPSLCYISAPTNMTITYPSLDTSWSSSAREKVNYYYDRRFTVKWVANEDAKPTKVSLNTTAASTSTGLKLSWESVNAKGYQVYRKLSGEDSYKKIATITNGSTTYTDTSAANGKTAYYKVRAFHTKSSGTKLYGDYSTSRTFRYLGTKPTLTVTGGYSEISLKWDKVPGANSYTIYRKTEWEDNYTVLTTTTSTSYKDSTTRLISSYKVFPSYQSEKTSVSGITSSAKSGGSFIESGISTVTRKSSGAVLSFWGIESEKLGYEVWRKTGSSGSYEKLGTTKNLTYTDKTIQDGKTYYYRIRQSLTSASGTKVYGPYCDSTKFISLAKPTGLTVTCKDGGLQIKWNAVEKAKTYEIYWKRAGETEYTFRTWTTETSYMDYGLDRGEVTYYKIAAESGGFVSLQSSAVSGVKMYSVSLRNERTSEGFKLTWEDGDGATGFEVWRKTGSGSYEKLGTTKNHSYKDTTVKTGKEYTYRVRPYFTSDSGKKYYGEYTYWTGYCLAKPAAPTVTNTADGLLVTWDKVSGVEGYYVWAKSPWGDSYNINDQVTGTSYLYRAHSGEKWSFKIQAYKGSATSALSGYTTKYAAMPVGNVTVEVCSDMNFVRVTLDDYCWDTTGFYVYRKVGDGDFERIATVADDSNQYLDYSVEDGKTYTYYVRAFYDTPSGSRYLAASNPEITVTR